MDGLRVISAIATSVAVWIVSFRWFFAELGEAKESLRFWFQPNLISLLKGEFIRDINASHRAHEWLWAGLLAGIAAYAIWGLLGLG